jgi:hypothetical protein
VKNIIQDQIVNNKDQLKHNNVSLTNWFTTAMLSIPKLGNIIWSMNSKGSYYKLHPPFPQQFRVETLN